VCTRMCTCTCKCNAPVHEHGRVHVNAHVHEHVRVSAALQKQKDVHLQDRMLARAAAIITTAKWQAIGTVVVTACAMGWTVSARYEAPLSLVWTSRFFGNAGAAMQLMALTWSNAVFMGFELASLRPSNRKNEQLDAQSKREDAAPSIQTSRV